MPEFVKVARKSEVEDQSSRLIEVKGKRIALFNLSGEFYAIDDTCPHADGPLSEGVIEGEEVECPWHSSRFNIKSGEVTEPPASEGVAKYAVRLVGEDVEVEV